MRPNLAVFATPVKIRGGVGEISGLRFKALPMIEPGVQISWASSAPVLRKVYCQKKKVENVAIANALQLEAARRRAVPMRRPWQV